MTEQEVNNLIDSKIGKTKMSQLPEATQTSGLYSIGYTGNQSVKYKANLLQGDPLTVRKNYQTEAEALADKNPIDTTTSLPLKVGQFVSIVDDGEKNGIYRISSIGVDGTMSLELQGKLGDLSEYAKKGGSTKTLKEVDDEKADHGYASIEVSKTLKQVEDNASVKIENLVENGDFRNGTTGWLGLSALIMASYGVLKITKNSTGGFGSAEKTFNWVEGDVYYINADMRAVGSFEASAIFIRNSGFMIVEQLLPVKNQWYNLSAIYTPTSAGNLRLTISGESTESTEGEAKNIKAINLTKTFGAGNEPTKEEFELFLSTLGIDYFEGEITIPAQKIMQWQLKSDNNLYREALLFQSLTHDAGNLYRYPEKYRKDHYINTNIDVINSAPDWILFGIFEVREGEWYSFYDLNGGSVGQSSYFTFLKTTDVNTESVLKEFEQGVIINGIKAKAPVGAKYAYVTLRPNNSVNVETMVFTQGDENVGYVKTLNALRGFGVNSEDILGNIKTSQLDDDSNVLKTDADNALTIANATPLNKDIGVIRNAVNDLYSNEEDVDVGGLNMFTVSPLDKVSAKRIYRDELYNEYKVPNAIRVLYNNSENKNGYNPQFSVRLSNDDLKKIGIDVLNSETTQKISLRFAIDNLVNITWTQLWFNLLYTSSPYDHSVASNKDVLYLGSGGVISPSLNTPVTADNPSKDLTLTGRDILQDGTRTYYFDNMPIHKELIFNGVTHTFKGIIFSSLPYPSYNDSLLGYDVHSIAVVNSEEYPFLTMDTNLLNMPDDVLLNNSKNEEAKSVDVRKLTVQNSDKIAFYGSSFTESSYAIMQKSWLNKLGEFTDWIIGNFGVSGNRIVDIVSRIRSNGNPYSTTGIKEFSPSVISISNSGNETVEDMPNIDYYRQELLLAQQAVSEIGAEMLIGSEQTANTAQAMALYGIADELGIESHVNGIVGNLVLSNGYSGFWGGSHPATRTNAHNFLEWLKYVEKMRKPERALKIFRVRSEYKAGSPSIDDLSYDTIKQRARYFKEINAGERGLTENDGSWKNYDRLNLGYSSSNYSNEYANLISNLSIQFEDFALVEFTIDRLRPTSLELKLNIDLEPTKIYLANNNSESTQYATNKNNAAFEVSKAVYDSFNEVIGENFTSSATASQVLKYEGKASNSALEGHYLFFSSTTTASNKGAGVLTKTSNSTTLDYIKTNHNISRHKFFFVNKYEQPWSRFEEFEFDYKDGLLTIDLGEDFSKYMQYDKVRLLIQKEGSFGINHIEAEYKGGVEKKSIVAPKYEPKRAFKELNIYKGFGTDWITEGGWVNNNAILKQMPSTERDYPYMNDQNHHIELGFDSENLPTSIEKSFDIDNFRGNRKVIVRVVSRLFPKIYNEDKTPDDYYTNDRQIYPDSYDYGTLVVALKDGDGTFAPLKRVTDIGWSEAYFETYLTWNETDIDRKLTVKIYRDDADIIDADNYRNHLYPLQVYDVSVQVEGE